VHSLPDTFGQSWWGVLRETDITEDLKAVGLRQAAFQILMPGNKSAVSNARNEGKKTESKVGEALNHRVSVYGRYLETLMETDKDAPFRGRNE